MCRTFTVTENGKTVQHLASPEMEAVFKRIDAFNKKNPDFWCKCESPDSDKFQIFSRGHSVDVQCGVCLGMIQVG